MRARSGHSNALSGCPIFGGKADGRYDVAKTMRLFEEANALYRIG